MAGVAASAIAGTRFSHTQDLEPDARRRRRHAAATPARSSSPTTAPSPPGNAEPATPDPKDNAHGIFAQSVGGGGGHGGLAGTFTLGTNQSGGSAQVNVGIAVGGKGGRRHVGGSVYVNNSGCASRPMPASPTASSRRASAAAAAPAAPAIRLRSSGLSAASSATYDIEFAIGGGGGTGNHAGPVTVGNQGSIETFAADSHGIYAHSVGGGGGSGGSAYTLAWNFLYATPSKTPPPKGKENYELQVRVGGSGGSGGDGDTVTITNAASIHTRGPDLHGILGYSVGGGGGDGGAASGIYGFPIPLTDRTPILQDVSISVGGSGASNGTGGEVDVTHTAGDITTEGQGSAGIYAQSVGAGGGTGGTGAAGATGTVAIGGTGGAAGDGGDVTVKFSGGSITTLGGQTPSTDPNKDLDSSYGIFAQSVGGGGGHAGNATFFGLPSSVPVAGQPLTGITIGIGLGIDLAGGNAGNGGTIEVDASGDITTQGPNAVGIFAQSVGGGGGLSGNLGFSPASEQALIGSVGGNGAGGAVDVTYTGNLTTAGGGAHGIFAQSAGGSGSATVTVDVTGSVAASGSEAAGDLRSKREARQPRHWHRRRRQDQHRRWPTAARSRAERRASTTRRPAC